jgi:hypothetical protein
LTIRVNADHPANWALYGETTPPPGNDVLDTLIILTAPNGADINVYNSGGGVVYRPPASDDIDPGLNTNSLIEGLVLPVDGVYQVEVSGAGSRTGGEYTLIIESAPPGSPRLRRKRRSRTGLYRDAVRGRGAD